MTPPVRRAIIVSAIIIVVLGFTVYGFIPKPFSVETAAAKRGPMRVTVEEEGKTRVRDRFVISAPVSGFMRRIELSIGDAVRKGQVLAELEPLRPSNLDPRTRAEAEAAASSARASLSVAQENAKAAEAGADYAVKKLARSRELFKEGFIPKDVLDQSEAEANKTEATRRAALAAVSTAAHELERLQAALLHTAAGNASGPSSLVRVLAPESGRILKLHHESAGVVNAGEPLIDIGNPSGIEVKAEVLSADAVKIRPGTPVLFNRWGGDTPLKGKVRVVEPAGFTKISSLGVEEQRVLVVSDITTEQDKWRNLGDGYSLETAFVVWEAENVLQIPSSSLFRHGEDWSVFVLADNKAVLRKVALGHRNGLTAEALSGVSEGERVIIHPDESIKDGSAVRLR